LIAFLSPMFFDAPDAWQQAGPEVRAWLILVITTPVPLGAALFSAARFHEKGRFGVIVPLTLFAVVYFVFPYILLFILQR
jgi:hypothetical protein